MRLDWEASAPYDDAGGQDALRAAMQDALAVIPREHLRQLDYVSVHDRDPKGKALGVWRQDHRGQSIELYLLPHLEDAQRVPADARLWAVRLSLAHTLFHEVGHHVTLHLNRRAAPARKKAHVTQTVEKWAEAYVAKRLQRLCAGWLAEDGPAHSPAERAKLDRALRFLGYQTSPLG